MGAGDCPTASRRSDLSLPVLRPFCNNKRISLTNRLDRCYPDLAAQWHPEKNGALHPSDFVRGSHARVWWKCPKGPDHEWQTRIDLRINGGRPRDCPFCRHHCLSVTNRLDLVEAKIAAEWHPTRNGALRPSDVRFTEERKVWWRCPVGHDWRAPIRYRTHLGTSCPHCHERKPKPAMTFRRRRRAWLPSDWSS